MLQYYTENKSDLFSTQFPVIVHGTNCHGVMGAGVARVVAEKYPDVYGWYKAVCANGDFQLGGCQLLYSAVGKKWIANLATQYDLGSDARLSAVEVSLHNLAIKLNKINVGSVAMPMIGCGIGGLNWTDVSKLVKRFAKQNEIQTAVHYL